MDAGQIVDHATRLVGMEDPAAQDIAWEFLRNRWSMVWGAQLWRTGLKTATFGPDYYRDFLTLPSVPEMVSEVSTDGIQYFPESVAGPDSARFTVDGPTITLIPPLAVGASAFVRFKVPAAELEETTLIPLPGAAECLLAYVTGDLYEYMRQMAKAQVKLQEGTALLERMRLTEVARRSHLATLIPSESLRWDEPRA
ncbi:MAG: hypothetical protein WCJ96_11280 [Verrucomicrobiota bacterium]|jgi:hypothetical protein